MILAKGNDGAYPTYLDARACGMKLLALAALLIVRTEIAPGVVLIPGQLAPDRSPDGNSVLLRGSDGWVVIDTGRGGEHTDEILRFLADAEAPPRAVLNTHWHLDHIGGNADFRREWPKATIVAHPALDSALAGFHAANRVELEKLISTIASPPLKARLETELALLKLDRELAADEGVTTSGPRTLAGSALDLHVETRAVSDGDLWILDQESKTLITGDLVTLPVPLFDTACPEGWQQALSRMADVEFETLVPGHGDPLTRESFSTYRRGFDALLACAGSGAENTACIDGWFREVKAEDSPYARELLGYYVKQFLRPDAPGRRRWCEG
jgi:glyoxylase-like metal-dependent hydrolase (beta-lactamase superfamily II)